MTHSSKGTRSVRQSFRQKSDFHDQHLQCTLKHVHIYVTLGSAYHYLLFFQMRKLRLRK